MDYNKLISKLNSSSSSEIYKTLLIIRSDLSKTQEGIKLLTDKACLKILVNFLNKPNEKILDVSLSILGNCSLHNDIRTLLRDCHIIKPLILILQNINRDSIRGRACRLIGNLAQSHSFAADLHKEDVVPTLVFLLNTEDESTSHATQQMAVRALRNLWSLTNKRTSMLNEGTVNTILNLLLKAPEEHQELYKVILKALIVFTNHCPDICAKQIYADGKGFEFLITLIENPDLKELALACLCNLCYAYKARSELGNKGFIAVLIKEISQDDGLEKTDLIISLCLLSHCGNNRVKLYDNGGFPLIISILKNSKSTNIKSIGLYTLLNFLYDKNFIRKFINHGLIDVLIERLENYVEINKTDHKVCKLGKSKCKHYDYLKKFEQQLDMFEKQFEKEENKEENDIDFKCWDDFDFVLQKKRNLKRSSESNILKTRQEEKLDISNEKRFRLNSPNYRAVMEEQSSPEIHRVNNGYNFSPEWSPASPCSSSGAGGRSPESCSLDSNISSPPRSPSFSEHSEEAYSPVCDMDSDNEKDSEEKDDNISEEETEKPIPQITDKQLGLFVTDEVKKYHDVKIALGPELILLSRIMYINTKNESLANVKTVDALLDYISKTHNPQPRAERILLKLLRNHDYFVPLLLNNIVFILNKRLCTQQHSQCCHCERLTVLGTRLLKQISHLAESGFGEGELAYHLLKADTKIKITISLSIPFIVKGHVLLLKLMVGCKGLEIIIGLLKNDDLEIMSQAGYSLAVLASSLGIKNPQSLISKASILNSGIAKKSNHLQNNENNSDIKKSPDSVNLILDDGNFICVNKNVLCDNSPVFEAMLRGNFRESTQSSINLPHISRECIEQLMYFDFPNLNLDTALELLSAMDRFLINGQENLIHLIIKTYLNPKTIFTIYTGAMNCDTLRKNAIKYLFTFNNENNLRGDVLNELLQSPHKSLVLKDIVMLMNEKFDEPSLKRFVNLDKWYIYPTNRKV